MGKKSDGSSREAKDRKKSAALGALSQSAKAKQEMAQMKASAASSSLGAGSSSYKFGVLAKIVRHMKTRHMEGEDHRLNLDEILDETNQLDVSNKVKVRLSVKDRTEKLGE